MFTLSSDKIRQAIGTKSVQKENISILNDYFFPVLVQEEIEKAYELRVFFMKDDFYAMAIFSQNDIQTKLDFRNYDRTKPNRNVPYCLPESVKLKLQEFNKQMGLDTGSIDLIVTPKNEFIFLEVNHIGQFGWLSDNCNYYIEEKIALYFKSIENEKKTNFYS